MVCWRSGVIFFQSLLENIGKDVQLIYINKTTLGSEFAFISLIGALKIQVPTLFALRINLR